MRPNPVKAKLARGEAQFGTMILDLAGPGLAKIFENAGADFIMYDMEAACFDIGKIKDQMAMCRGLKIVPMVNVASQDPVMMQLPLDCGAMGLMIPVVETREQAEKIAAITHYPPKGKRGVAFGIAQGGSGHGHPHADQLNDLRLGDIDPLRRLAASEKTDSPDAVHDGVVVPVRPVHHQTRAPADAIGEVGRGLCVAHPERVRRIEAPHAVILDEDLRHAVVRRGQNEAVIEADLERDRKSTRLNSSHRT